MPGADPLGFELEGALKAVFREELAAVERQLSELRSGQTALICSMEHVRDKLGIQLTGTNEALPKDASPYQSIPQRVDLPLHQSVLQEQNFTNAVSVSSRDDLQEEMAEAELKRLVDVSHEAYRRDAERLDKFRHASWSQRLQMLEHASKEMILDAVASAIIISNSVFIGISYDEWDGNIDSIFFVIDVVFCVLFAAELIIKIRVLGCSSCFCGPDWLSSIFDVSLVSLDTIQLVIVIAAKELSDNLSEHGIPSASLFRIVRLLRITRIIRIFRHLGGADLLDMMEGIGSGLSTLGWAVVIFFIMIYVVSLLCRSVLGQKDEITDVYFQFSSLPRSMYTVFRCSFGDCSTPQGTPIPEILNQHYGAVFAMLYSLFTFFVTIGLFNVISAIFVGSTMARIAERDVVSLQGRFADDELWATRVCLVIRRCLIKAGHDLENKEIRIDSTMLALDIPRGIVDDLCQHDEETIAALNDLDIDPHDHRKLADILDPDHSGTIGFVELVRGLHRLRGQPRRSDIVTIDLMLRATQERIDDIHKALSANRKVHDFMV